MLQLFLTGHVLDLAQMKLLKFYRDISCLDLRPKRRQLKVPSAEFKNALPSFKNLHLPGQAILLTYLEHILHSSHKFRPHSISGDHCHLEGSISTGGWAILSTKASRHAELPRGQLLPPGTTQTLWITGKIKSIFISLVFSLL